jgi:transporter family-2 protein
MYYIFAFTAGALTLVSMITNSNLSKYVGTAQSTLVNFASGLIVSIILYFFWNKQAFQFINFPLWALLGGFLGVFIVIISNIVIPKIPTIYTTLLIFIGQLLTGILIDFLLTKTFNIYKLIGASLIVIGLFYNFMVDKKINNRQKYKKENLNCKKSI